MAVNRHRYKGVISYVDGPYQTYTFTVYTKLRGDGPYFWATLENAKGDLKEVYDFQEYEDVERYFEILKNEIKAGENL